MLGLFAFGWWCNAFQAEAYYTKPSICTNCSVLLTNARFALHEEDLFFVFFISFDISVVLMLY